MAGEEYGTTPHVELMVEDDLAALLARLELEQVPANDRRLSPHYRKAGG